MFNKEDTVIWGDVGQRGDFGHKRRNEINCFPCPVFYKNGFQIVFSRKSYHLPFYHESFHDIHT